MSKNRNAPVAQEIATATALVTTALLLSACEGDKGPLGPQGPSGDNVAEIHGRIFSPDWNCVDCWSNFRAEVSGVDGVPELYVNGVQVLSPLWRDALLTYSSAIRIQALEPASIELHYWQPNDADVHQASATVVLPGYFELEGVDGDDYLTFTYGIDNTLSWGPSEHADFYDVRGRVFVYYDRKHTILTHSSVWSAQITDLHFNLAAEELWPSLDVGDQIIWIAGSVEVIAVSGPKDGERGNITGEAKGSMQAMTFGRGRQIRVVGFRADDVWERS